MTLPSIIDELAKRGYKVPPARRLPMVCEDCGCLVIDHDKHDEVCEPKKKRLKEKVVINPADVAGWNFPS